MKVWPIADEMGLYAGQLSIQGLCTLGKPYKIPGLEPDEHNLKYTSLVILPLSNKLLKIAFKRISWLIT